MQRSAWVGQAATQAGPSSVWLHKSHFSACTPSPVIITVIAPYGQATMQLLQPIQRRWSTRQTTVALDSLNRADIGAGCIFTLPAQGGRRQRIAFHHPDTGRKLSRRNRRTTLVVLMGDHAGHFTGTAANTLLGIRDDKTVHPLLHWG
jgi:hypothetical protein